MFSCTLSPGYMINYFQESHICGDVCSVMLFACFPWRLLQTTALKLVCLVRQDLYCFSWNIPNNVPLLTSVALTNTADVISSISSASHWPAVVWHLMPLWKLPNEYNAGRAEIISHKAIWPPPPLTAPPLKLIRQWVLTALLSNCAILMPYLINTYQQLFPSKPVPACTIILHWFIPKGTYAFFLLSLLCNIDKITKSEVLGKRNTSIKTNP